MSERQPKQDTFFKIVLAVASFYLIAFAADGALSLIDDGLRALSLPLPIEGLRNAVAALVIAATFLMVPVLVFVPRLPKTVFLPPILFVLWAAFGAPLLPIAGGEDQVRMLILDGIELALAAGLFLYVRKRTGMWLLRAGALKLPRDAGLKIALWAVGTVVVLPVLIACLFVLNLGSMIETQTNGYIHFSVSGIDLQETVLRKGEKSITLVGMLHIGEPKFYDALYASFPRGALILEEGVTDREKRLTGNLSYQKFARVLGLEQQPALTPRIEPAETGTPSAAGGPSNAVPASSISVAANGASVLRPDVDISEFSDTTISFLSRVSEIYQAKGFFDALLRIQAVMKDLTPADIESFFHDVVEKRNAHVLAAVDAELPHYHAIVIPWGAMHMPGLEKAIKARGFVVESRRRLPLARYSIMVARLRHG